MKTSLNEENERKSQLLSQLGVTPTIIGPLQMSLVNRFPIASQVYTLCVCVYLSSWLLMRCFDIFFASYSVYELIPQIR